MKLDYLQFLELEIFTRFGARLEASMEKAILRGRLLREILKQDRLSPLSILFQMAWLVAFNDGLFDGVSLDIIPKLLEKLERSVQDTTLRIESPRVEWSGEVAGWLEHPPRDAST